MYKDFDLERAKKGDPVLFKHFMTDNFRETRILCFDRKSTKDRYPVVALINFDTDETMGAFDRQGCDPNGAQRLFMAPVKRQEWVNIYRDPSHPAGYRTGNVLHASHEAAEKGATERSFNPNNFVRTILIREWEE